MVQVNKATLRRVKLFDWAARGVITLGGIVVIGSVIAVVGLLASVVFPLFAGAHAKLRVEAPLPADVPAGDVLALGIDLVELGSTRDADALSAYTLSRDGTFTFFTFDKNDKSQTPPGACRASVLDRQKVSAEAHGPSVTFVDQSTGSETTLLWSDGSVSLVEAAATAQFDELGRRSIKYALNTRASLPPEEEGAQAVRAVARAAEGGSTTCAKLLDDGRIVVVRQTVAESLFGGGQTKTSRLVISSGVPGAVTAMTLNRRGNTLFLGTENGYLARWKLNDQGEILQKQTVAVPGRAAVTALTMVFGDVSLTVGDASGDLTTWAPVRSESSKEEKLRLVHRLSRHREAVRAILPSQRDKSLLSLGGGGRVFLDYMTSQKHLLTLAGDHPLAMMGYSPRGNAMVGLDRKTGGLLVWQIDSPHPQISWGTLFGKVWYDNHDEPKTMWQSSGTDEPKFSLVPVLFGTLKATLYAMLVAVPLALLSAMYVSHFTTPGFKRVIKPAVEVMAAVPTVVVGFLILLWAAPLVGSWIVGVFAAVLTIPVTFVLFMFLWQALRRFDWAKRVEHGYEFLVLVPVIVLGAALAVWLAGPLENALFGGDFRQWLFDTTHARYDQLNSLVVAFGLGFAVIPIIFSISEDSLSDIPYSLTAASAALGASRWQTVWRVVLPSASPGIFAAIMIGFGRAVGETMIVFMATGNTPILDWSPFNGFRTLSANIAVEISEAPRDGTLYRVLFLCAAILFLMTFVLNTAAEMVRSHLRKKYGRY